jgi:hypothetical protein
MTFICQHPEQFSNEVVAMAAYQITKETDDYLPLGGLPDALEEVSRLSMVLEEKAKSAERLAEIVLSAEPQMLAGFASDTSFEEKKAFFATLAALPEDYRGLLAIHGVSENLINSGQLPLVLEFNNDLEYVTSQVKALGALLNTFEDKYSPLFLAVRRATVLSRAAAKAKGVA